MLYRLLVILFIATQFACTPVRFDKPQPSDLNNLPTFPSEIIGTYLSFSSDTVKSSTDTIHITPNSFVYYEDENQIMSMQEAKEAGVLIHDNGLTWPSKYPNRLFPYESANDTLRFVAYRQVSKTLGDSIKVRQFKKDYYLNTLDSLGWEVLMLKETKTNEYTLYEFSIPNKSEELKQYNKITPIEVRNYSPTFEYYYLKPTPKEFYKLIKAGMAKPLTTLKKIK